MISNQIFTEFKIEHLSKQLSKLIYFLYSLVWLDTLMFIYFFFKRDSVILLCYKDSFNIYHKIFVHNYSAWSPQPWRKWPVLSFSWRVWTLRNTLDKCIVVVVLGLGSRFALISARRFDDEFDGFSSFAKAA